MSSRAKQITEAASTGHPRWIRGLHVCIVDDSMASRKAIKRILTRQGHHVTEAGDGAEIVERFSEEGGGQVPEVILMGNVMSKMNGPFATMMLRDKGYSGLIVGLVSDVFNNDTQLFETAGANQILAKPLDLMQLQRVVSLWLTLQGMWPLVI